MTTMLKSTLKILLVLILCAGLFSAKQRPMQVFMAGDSTMAQKPLTKSVTDTLLDVTYEENFLERGWGMLLSEYLDDGAIVRNYAQNGRSTRTFIEQGWWDKIISQVQTGDAVIIQFAHNDCAINKPDRYTTPEDYRKNLIRFVDDVKAKKGKPILCTAIARRKFDKKAKLVDTHGVYPHITREVAHLNKVPMIDMQKMTTEWLEELGIEESRQYFHKIPADGSSKLFPKGLDDNTHLNEKGARIVAGFFALELQNKRINPISKHLNLPK